MSMVDTIKALRNGIEDRLLPQRFVYHHIPKCGGTSVGRALRKRYLLSQATVTPEESFRAFELFTGRSDREQMLIDVVDLRKQMMLYHMFHDVRGLSLHVPFADAAWRQFGDRYKFITILRDPVERFVSHYHWSHAKNGAHARIEDDFETFLASPRARRIGAMYVEFFCGLDGDVALDSAPVIERAILNLDKFAVIGDLADLPRFEADLKRELGMTVRIGHENKGKRAGKGYAELADPALRARIEAVCAPDIAVWNAFTQRRAAAATGNPNA